MSAHVDGSLSRDGFELDVDVDVADGEVLAVLGPNGSGKTTLLRVVAGLERVDRGVVTVGGRAVDGPDGFVPPEARRVGYVPQGYGLFDHRSALDNVAFGPRARGLARRAARERARGALDALSIGDLADRRPHELSGGQAQRVALARALAVEPDVVLLDEPLAALDIASRRAVRRELRRALEVVAGARLIVTHDPLDVYAVADRVAVLEGGRVVQTGTIAEVTARPRSAFVAQLVGTNLIDGVVADGVLSTIGGVRIEVVTEVAGPAMAVIRPSSVTIGRVEPRSSVRNSFEVVVDDLVSLDGRVRVGLAGAVDLTAEITTGARDALDLRPGDRVVASFKATDIEVTAR